MIARARVAAPEARLVARRAKRCRGDATFRIAFTASTRSITSPIARWFFAEARRILKPGGGLLDDRQGPDTPDR